MGPSPRRPQTRLDQIDTSRIASRVRPRVRPRGLPPALERHLIGRTTNPQRAEDLAAPLLGPHRVRVTDARPGDFMASLHALQLSGITLAHLDYGCAVTIEVRRLPSSFLIIVPMSGHATVRIPRSPGTGPSAALRATPTLAVIPPPPTPVRVDCNRQAPLLLVLIDEDALLVHLSRILGRPLDDPLRFNFEFDLGCPIANRWNVAIQLLHAEMLDNGSLLERGVGTRQLEEFVMSSLLFAQRSNYSSTLTRPGHDSENRTTRAAKDFIEHHLSEPLAVSDIAEAAGVSERTLQAAFQQEMSTTPMGYLRARRLDRARADLATAAPTDDVTVTFVAERWGFGHLGRFAAEYKQRFGESPSRTLRR